MSAPATTPPPNDSNRRNNANRRNNNTKKKPVFKGDVEGFEKVLQLPSERDRGVASQYDNFLACLKRYVPRQVATKSPTAQIWATQYLGQDDRGWEPPYPIKPTKPEDDADDKEKIAYLKDHSTYKSMLEGYEKAIGFDWDAAKLQIWSTILGQCLSKLRSQLEKMKFFEDASKNYDCLALLENAAVLSGGGQVLGFEPQARADALISLVRCKQNNMSLEEYVNEFKVRHKIFKTLGGNLDKQDSWTGPDGATMTTNQAFLVCMFLANANKKDYGKCTRGLRNNAASKSLRYPETMEDAYTMLDEFVKAPKQRKNNSKSNNNNEDVEAYLDIDHSRPENKICMTSTKYAERLLDAWWLLLDTASTVTIFCNAIFLRGIRKANKPTIIHTTGGRLVATLEGWLPFLQKWVAYHPDCLGNILSFRDVLDAHHVSLNSRNSRNFVVHCLCNRKGRTIKKVHFRPSGTGLFYFDTNADLRECFKCFPESLKSFPVNNEVNYEIANATVEENVKAFSSHQRSGIEKAREVYADVGRPSFENFLRMIKYRQIPNLPIKEQDARNMVKAYGPDVHALRGKTVQRKANHVPSLQRILPPDSILRANKNIVLCTDIFFVDSIIFLLAVSRNIQHVFVEALESRAMINRVLPLLKHCNNKYAMQGFNVREIHADLEFAPLRDEFLKPENGSINVHICAAGAHVPEAEQNIRTVKDRDRSTVVGLPYKYYPRILKIAIVKESARYLNIIPHADGVSEVFGPFTLIEGHHNDYEKHNCLRVGQYCEVHDEPDPSNTETVRTTSGIVLGPSPEFDGSWCFMSLQTGKKVTRRAWTPHQACRDAQDESEDDDDDDNNEDDESDDNDDDNSEDDSDDDDDEKTDDSENESEDEDVEESDNENINDNEDAHLIADRTKTDDEDFLTAPVHYDTWKEAYDEEQRIKKAEECTDTSHLRAEHARKYSRLREETLENHGRYVEDVEESPIPSRETGALNKKKLPDDVMKVYREECKLHIIFLPPNVTSVLQPADQGMIATLKVGYKAKYLSRLLDLFDKEGGYEAAAQLRALQPSGCKGLHFGGKPHVLDAMEILHEIWSADDKYAKKQGIINCWKKSGVLPKLPDENADENTDGNPQATTPATQTQPIPTPPAENANVDNRSDSGNTTVGIGNIFNVAVAAATDEATTRGESMADADQRPPNEAETNSPAAEEAPPKSVLPNDMMVEMRELLKEVQKRGMNVNTSRVATGLEKCFIQEPDARELTDEEWKEMATNWIDIEDDYDDIMDEVEEIVEGLDKRKTCSDDSTHGSKDIGHDGEGDILDEDEDEDAARELEKAMEGINLHTALEGLSNMTLYCRKREYDNLETLLNKVSWMILAKRQTSSKQRDINEYFPTKAKK